MNKWEAYAKRIAEIKESYNMLYCEQVLTLEEQMDMALAYNDEDDIARVQRLMDEGDMEIEAVCL